MNREHRREPLEPAPEAYEGVNIPYRGIEEHGVPATRTVIEEDEHLRGEKPVVQFMESEKEQEPVPVRIVTEHGREEKRWQVTRTILATGQTTPLVPRQDTRTQVMIRVISGSVSIGDGFGNANVYLGYPLNAGETFTTDAVTPIYAYATEQTDVAVLTTFSVET